MPVARLPIEAIQIAKQFTGEIDLLVKDVVMSRIDGGVLAPVSYTHLDVYKRQGKDCAGHADSEGRSSETKDKGFTYFLG